MFHPAPAGDIKPIKPNLVRRPVRRRFTKGGSISEGGFKTVGHYIWYITQLSQIDFCGQLSRENRALEKPFFSADNPYLGGNRYKIRLLKQLRKKRSSLKFSRWLCRYQHCGAHLGPTKGLRGIQYIVVVSSRTKKWMISPAARGTG